MSKIDIKEIGIENKEFWSSFFAVSYPNGYDEDMDLSVEEIVSQFADMEWWDDFTGYDEEVFEENDGYLEEPMSVEAILDGNRTLKVEFHPGDILYYINGENVGSTGPHWKLQIFDFTEIVQLLTKENGEIAFLLLLPLARILANDVSEAEKRIEVMLEKLFDTSVCEDIVRCLVNQLIEERN